MGDLAFGESFGCLTQSDYHPWCAALSGMARQLAILLAIANLGFEWVVTMLLISGNLAKRNKNQEITREKLLRRMSNRRNDLLTALLDNWDKVTNTSVLLHRESSQCLLGNCVNRRSLLI
jgi:averantin hydroxylase